MTFHFFVVKGPAADATDAPQPRGLLCNPVMKMISFFFFPCNGAQVEWNWQAKTEVLGEKPVSVPLCPTQIPHGPNRDRTPRGERPATNRLSHGTADIPQYFSYSLFVECRRLGRTGNFCWQNWTAELKKYQFLHQLSLGDKDGKNTDDES
jgi:hypothetical protein